MANGLDLDDTVARFRAGSLPRSAWTHEAHLLVALALLRENHDPDEVIDELRDLITAYNAHTGMRPDRAACHQTITAYYVRAIAESSPATVEEMLIHPWCSRRAPLQHWTKATLTSNAARRGWVAPDRDPLPWTSPTIGQTDETDNNQLLHSGARAWEGTK